jgi:hypothetical protein
MSSLVINGDTSGSITLAAPAVAGSPVLTLPTVTGTILSTTSPKTGNVLQVVQGITPSNYSTSSSSSTATGYGLSITPTSASSKILILAAGTMDTNANNQAVISVRRGTTDLGSGNNSNTFSAGGRVISSLTIMFLDSPATTSSTTYNFYFNAGSSTTITWYGGATMTLMEIAA